MRVCFVFACVAGLTFLPWRNNPQCRPSLGRVRKSGDVSADAKLKDMFEAKIKVEWEALKNKDKKAYGELLADDYQGVEVDGRGERNKIQAVNELADDKCLQLHAVWVQA